MVDYESFRKSLRTAINILLSDFQKADLLDKVTDASEGNTDEWTIEFKSAEIIKIEISKTV